MKNIWILTNGIKMSNKNIKITTKPYLSEV